MEYEIQNKSGGHLLFGDGSAFVGMIKAILSYVELLIRQMESG